jgi:TonB family protein
MCRRARWPRHVVAAALFAAFAAPAFGQQTDLDLLAARVAERIAEKKYKTVVVADFHGLDDRLIALGPVLAREFAAALARTGKNLQLVESARLQSISRKLKLPAIDLEDPVLLPVLGKLAGAQAAIGGTLELQSGTLLLAIHMTEFRKGPDAGLDPPGGQSLGAFRLPLALTPEWKLLMQTALPAPADGLYVPGLQGATAPECVDCPYPDYAPAGLARSIRANVVFRVTITPEGAVKNLAIVREIGFGMDQVALAALESWKFKPGHLPDGTPVAVRCLVEVGFRYILPLSEVDRSPKPSTPPPPSPPPTRPPLS